LKARTLDSNPDNIKVLADNLSKCPEVTRYDTEKEKEAWVLALSFDELEDSFNRFLYEHLPRLADTQATPSEVYNILLDIGEEFRHIMYHIHDPMFYKYLNNIQSRE